MQMKSEAYPFSSYPWQTSHDLRFADIDANGHINNGAFSAIMESSRSLMFFSDDIKDVAPYNFVLARFEIDFFSSLSFPGTVRAGVGVLRVGKTSLLLKQALFNPARCVAEAYSTIVATDPATGRPRELGDALRMQFRRWLLAPERPQTDI
jgi:acyl-CoA thioester hydrolase